MVRSEEKKGSQGGKGKTEWWQQRGKGRAEVLCSKQELTAQRWSMSDRCWLSAWIMRMVLLNWERAIRRSSQHRGQGNFYVYTSVLGESPLGVGTASPSPVPHPVQPPSQTPSPRPSSALGTWLVGLGEY